MFSLAMKRRFVAEGKFSRNKSRPFTMLSLRLIFLSNLSYPSDNDISYPRTSKNTTLVRIKKR